MSTGSQGSFAFRYFRFERTAHLLIGMIEHNSNAMMDVRIRTTLVELGSVADRTRDRTRSTRKRQAH